MPNTQSIIEITSENLLQAVKERFDMHCRLVQIHCTKMEGHELSYSFDDGQELTTLRLQISDETVIPSITSIYPFAFLYENEMKDLFGVKIENINVDFNGNLYKLSVKTPFNPPKEEKTEQ